MSEPVTLVTSMDIEHLKTFAKITAASFGLGAVAATATSFLCSESAIHICIANAGEIGCRVALGSYLVAFLTKAHEVYYSL